MFLYYSSPPFVFILSWIRPEEETHVHSLKVLPISVFKYVWTCFRAAAQRLLAVHQGTHDWQI